MDVSGARMITQALYELAGLPVKSQEAACQSFQSDQVPKFKNCYSLFWADIGQMRTPLKNYVVTFVSGYLLNDAGFVIKMLFQDKICQVNILWNPVMVCKINLQRLVSRTKKQ